MGYWEDMLENTEEKALFFEVYMEKWPALLRLTEEQKPRLYATLTQALAAIDCPSQGMKVIGDHLYIVHEMSVDRCIDEVLNALETAVKTAFPKMPVPKHYSVYSMSAEHVIDAVVMLAG